MICGGAWATCPNPKTRTRGRAGSGGLHRRGDDTAPQDSVDEEAIVQALVPWAVCPLLLR